MDLTNYIQTAIKYRRFILVGILLLVIVWVLATQTILIVNLPETERGASLILRENPSQESGGKKIRAGINIVSKGELYIEAKRDGLETGVFTKTKILPPTTVNIAFAPKNKGEKITPNKVVAQCFFGNPVGEYYYCHNNQLYKKKLGVVSSGDVAFENVRIIGNPVSYKDGIITFATTPGSNQEQENYVRLSYISPSGETIIEASAGQYIDEYGGHIGARVGVNEFTVTNVSNKTVYAFSDTKKPPVSYSLSDDLPPDVIKKTIRSNIDGNRLLVSYSKPDRDDEKYTEGSGTPSMLSYEYNQSNIKKTGTINLPRGVLNSSNVMYFGNTILVLGISSDLWVLEYTEGKTSLVTSIPNVNAFTVGKSDAYISKRDKVYRLKPDSGSIQLVSTPPVSVTELFSSGSTVVFSGPQKNFSQSASFVALEETEKQGGNTLLDVLPYSPSDLPIISSDYSGKTVEFNVRLNSYRYVRDSTKRTYEPREFELKRNMILRKLRKDGINPQDYNIQFLPGPSS